MNKSKLKRSPKKFIDPKEAKNFINSAKTENESSKTESEEDVAQETKRSFPWDNTNVKIIKGINLRLTEPEWAKLKYISEKTPFSIQRFIMIVLRVRAKINSHF